LGWRLNFPVLYLNIASAVSSGFTRHHTHGEIRTVPVYFTDRWLKIKKVSLHEAKCLGHLSRALSTPKALARPFSTARVSHTPFGKGLTECMGRHYMLNFRPGGSLWVLAHHISTRIVLNTTFSIAALTVKGPIMNREELVNDLLRLRKRDDLLVSAASRLIFRALC
jgi:hypothetical protein